MRLGHTTRDYGVHSLNVRRLIPQLLLWQWYLKSVLEVALLVEQAASPAAQRLQHHVLETAAVTCLIHYALD